MALTPKLFRRQMVEAARMGEAAEPLCPHAPPHGFCGGCTFQDRSYATQIAAKHAALRALWEGELAAMRTRMLAMRAQLHAVLSAKLPGRDFGYFLSQRGMFSYTGLSAAQVDRLREEFAVYLIRSGRICVAGLNESNVERTAEAMATVLG